MRKLVTTITALVLVTAATLGQGCAAAIPLITQVASVVSSIVGTVDLIESQVRSASDAGLLPPDVADRATKVRALLDQLADAARQSPEAYAALVPAFERAWSDLTAIVAPFGVRAAPLGGRLGGAAPGTVQVPTASELGARLREARR